jgi:TM2 domain-containing membrane protein YozV
MNGSSSPPQKQLACRPQKDVLLALALSFLPAVVGFFGIGHFYLGKALRGIAFFIVGGFAAFLIVFGDPYLGIGHSDLFHTFLFVFLSLLVIANIVDVYMLVGRYNREGGTTGIAPW